MIWIISIFVFSPAILGVHSVGLEDCPKHLSTSQLYTYGEYCLQVSNQEKVWHDARSDCLHHGGDLVQVRDADMQFFLTGILSRDYHGYWIGAADLNSEGTWTWITGDPTMTYTNWGSGEGPSHSGGFFFGHSSNEDCAQIRTDDNFKWHDYHCNEALFHVYSYICQYDKVKHPKTTAPTTMKQTAMIMKETTKMTAEPTNGNTGGISQTVFVVPTYLNTNGGDPFQGGFPSTPGPMKTNNKPSTKQMTTTEAVGSILG